MREWASKGRTLKVKRCAGWSPSGGWCIYFWSQVASPWHQKCVHLLFEHASRVFKFSQFWPWNNPASLDGEPSASRASRLVDVLLVCPLEVNIKSAFTSPRRAGTHRRSDGIHTCRTFHRHTLNYACLGDIWGIKCALDSCNYDSSPLSVVNYAYLMERNTDYCKCLIVF